ncbi:MAG: CoxG family protein [Nitrososphaerales archaeon]
MHFDGKFDVKADKQKVFDFLLDPNALASCLPDLQKVDVISQDEFKVTVKVGISFIKGTMDMTFKVTERDPPNHAKLQARGTGVGSSIDMTTGLDLVDGPDGGTSMNWTADANVGGMIASIGQRLLNNGAEKMVTQLFDSIKTNLEKE